MGVFGLLFGLPLLPLRGALALAEFVAEQAEHELHDVSSISRHLEEVEDARIRGLISDEEAAQAQYDAVQRLIWQPGAG